VFTTIYCLVHKSIDVFQFPGRGRGSSLQQLLHFLSYRVGFLLFRFFDLMDAVNVVAEAGESDFACLAGLLV